MYRELYLTQQLAILLFGLESTLLLGLVVTGKYIFKRKLCLFEQGISLSISIQYMYIKTNKVIHDAGSQVYPLLSTNMGVSSLHGLIVTSLRINQIHIKIDKVKIKPYLATP